jgi:hypothetical protein
MKIILEVIVTVLTDFLNPILDRIGFWQRLEGLIWGVFRLRRRVDTSVTSSRSTTARSPGDDSGIGVNTPFLFGKRSFIGLSTTPRDAKGWNVRREQFSSKPKMR